MTSRSLTKIIILIFQSTNGLETPGRNGYLWCVCGKIRELACGMASDKCCGLRLLGQSNQIKLYSAVSSHQVIQNLRLLFGWDSFFEHNRLIMLTRVDHCTLFL